MGFSPTVRHKALRLSARHCSVCHRYKGVKIDVHHLIQEADGGPNTIDNAIPLCDDCHNDAGHYNDRHPKGTKFSIPELKKDRDAWYDLVKTNAIPEKLHISEHIQTIYFVLHSFDILEKILCNDFSSVNRFRSKTYLASNEISMYWNELFKTHRNDYNSNIEQRRIIELRQFSSIDEYVKTYRNVILINKSENDHPYYEAKREVNWDELIKQCKPNSFITMLSQSGLNAVDCCLSLLYKNATTCGGETPEYGYSEILEINPLSFVFIGITNACNQQTKLNLLNTNKKSYSLPSFNLMPYEMVLFPVATAFNLYGIDNAGFCLERRDGDRGEDFSRIMNALTFEKEKVLFLNEYFEPQSIIYNNNNGEYEIEVHKFDYNNLYSINSYCQCGSCPHLFFVLENGKQTYCRELLKYSSYVRGVDSFIIPDNVFKVIIRELEDESTYLDKVIINNELLISDVILMKGQSLIFNVNPNDQIKIEGNYIPFSINSEKIDDIWIRNELVKKSNIKYNRKMASLQQSVNTIRVSEVC